MKNCPDEHKFDDDDDNGMGDNARAIALTDYYRRRIRCEETGFNAFKNFLLTYTERGDNAPICCYVGWDKDETEGVDYPYPVFWLEYTDGVLLSKKVHSCFDSALLASISGKQVDQADPQFEAHDHLTMYHIYHVNNPPQFDFDQREALKKHVKEEMVIGDFVVLTMNHSDDSVEDHTVTKNQNTQYKDEINGNTYKVFHLKQSKLKLAELLNNFSRHGEFKLRSVGKDCFTHYSVYRRER
jgi:hypothetical protein